MADENEPNEQPGAGGGGGGSSGGNSEEQEAHETDERNAHARESAKEQSVGAERSWDPEYDAPSADGTQGALQRLRLHVPTENTTLVLGHNHEAVGYPGISGVTNGQVFLTSEQQSMSMQAKQQVLLQSTNAKLFVLAKDNALFGSAKQSYLSGAGGVIIAAGQGPAPAHVGTQGSAQPEQALHSLSEAAEGANQAAEHAEQVAAGLTSIAAVLGGAASAAGIVGAAASIASTVASLCAGGEGGSVGIHGKTGAVMTSGANLAIGAKIAASILAGLQAEMLALGKVEIGSLGLATMVGGAKAAVESANLAEVLSGRKTEIASRFGEAVVVAPTVKIGEKATPGPQVPTSKVEVETTYAGKIILDAGFGSVEMKLDASAVEAEIKSDDKIKFDAHGDLEVLSQKEVKIKVGDYEVLVKPDQITIGKDGDSSISIKHDQIMILCNGDGFQAIRSGPIKMKYGGSTGVSCSSSGVKVEGSKIDLG